MNRAKGIPPPAAPLLLGRGTKGGHVSAQDLISPQGRVSKAPKPLTIVTAESAHPVRVADAGQDLLDSAAAQLTSSSFAAILDDGESLLDELCEFDSRTLELMAHTEQFSERLVIIRERIVERFALMAHGLARTIWRICLDQANRTADDMLTALNRGLTIHKTEHLKHLACRLRNCAPEGRRDSMAIANCAMAAKELRLIRRRRGRSLSVKSLVIQHLWRGPT
jgi:hypothetical protein